MNKKDCIHYMIRLCDEDKSYQCEYCDKVFYGLMHRVEQNEKLREAIVDFADLWDGKESSKYGERLQSVLDELGIKDVPKFYTKQSMNELLDELEKEREK